MRRAWAPARGRALRPHRRRPPRTEGAGRSTCIRGDPVVELERVRTADGGPVVFSRDIMIARGCLATNELAAMPLDGSLYEMFENAHGSAGGARRRDRRARSAPIERWRKRLGVKAGSCCCTCGRSTTGARASRCCSRRSTTWRKRSSSASSGVDQEGGDVNERRQGDAAQARDRPGGRVGDLCARSRDDVADVPRAARRHRGTDPGDGRRRCERDHDEQGHDPDRERGILADDVARDAAVGER